MPVQIQSSKFFTQLLNGEDFTLNTGQFYNQLTGNVGDLIKTEQVVQVSWNAETDGVNGFIIQGPNTVFRQAGDFLIDEFAVGDSISFYDTTTLGAPILIFTRNIISISSTTIAVDGAAFTTEVGFYADAEIFGLTTLEGARHYYGLVENGASTSYLSKITPSSTQLHSASGVTAASPSFVTMTPTPGVKSWLDDGNVKVKYDSTLGFDDDFAQVFTVEHVFRILPYFLDGELTNLQTLVPPSALFGAGKNLKYVMRLQFSPTLASFATKNIVSDQTNGLTAWFNENPIGFLTEYTIDAVTYEDVLSAITTTEIDSQRQTEVTIVVSSVNSNFIASTPFVLWLSYLPPEAQYNNNLNTIKENFLFESIYQVTGAAAKADAIISDLTGVFNNASQITVSFKTDYTTAQSLVIGDNDYLIGLTIKDPGSSSASENDQVALLPDVNVYDFDPDIENLMFIDKFEFYPRDLDDTLIGFDSIKGWIEDPFELKTTFKLNIDEPATLVDLKVTLSAYNATTGNSFDFDTYVFDLSGVVTSGGVQNINISGTRGFRQAPGNKFNVASIKKSTAGLEGSINVQKYDLKIGQFARMEEWIAQLDADPVFFDAAEPNNGLNKKVSNYFANGYTVKTIVEGVVEDPNGVLTTYTFLSQDHDFKDYDEDGLVPPDWSVVTELFDTFGNPLNEILNNDFTEIKATFTPDSGTTGSLDLAAFLHLYLDNTATMFNVDELTSFDAPAPNIALIPLTGSTFTKITDDGFTVVVEGKIDPTNLPSAVADYAVESRLWELNSAVLSPDLIPGGIMWLNPPASTNALTAAIFNRSNNDGLLSNAVALIPSTSFSVGGWFNLVNVGSAQYLISRYDAAVGSRQFRLVQLGDNTVQWRVFDSVDTAFSITSGVLSLGWHHFWAYYDDATDTIGMSIDGAAFLTLGGVTSLKSLGSSFRIGTTNFSTDGFNGRADQVFYYDKIPLISEVSTVYNAGAGLKFSSWTGSLLTSLVSVWEMNQLTGNRIDEHGVNDLIESTLGANVFASVGHIVEEAEEGEQIYQEIDQLPTLNHALQSVFAQQPLLTSGFPRYTTDDNMNIDAVQIDLAGTLDGGFGGYWRPIDGTPTSDEVLMSFGDTDANTVMDIRIDTTGKVVARFIIAGVVQWEIITDAVAVATNVWAHIWLNCDGVTPKIYIDSVEVAQTATTSFDLTAFFVDAPGIDNGRIACNNYNSAGNANHYNGDRQQAFVADEFLTVDNIINLYFFNQP